MSIVRGDQDQLDPRAFVYSHEEFRSWDLITQQGAPPSLFVQAAENFFVQFNVDWAPRSPNSAEQSADWAPRRIEPREKRDRRGVGVGGRSRERRRGADMVKRGH